MPKVLSDATAKWIQQQIHSRDLTSKHRGSPALSGACYPVMAIVARITGVVSPGIYRIQYETRNDALSQKITAIAVTLMNSLITSTSYNVGDKILVHNIECEAIPGEERS